VKGQVVHERVESEVLKGNAPGDPWVRRVPLYLPPSYATDSTRRYPVVYVLTGFTGRGRMLLNDGAWSPALDDRMDALIDGGAYAAGKVGPTLVVPAHNTLSGYHVPVTRLQARAVYTNAIPGGSMRAPGDPQSMFASESHVDMIAHAMGIDPIELRRRNALRDGDPSITGERVHRARAIEVLDALERESDWHTSRPAGRGRGVALGVRHIGAGTATVLMRLASGGRVEVLTGVADQGGGAHTVLRRVAAEIEFPSGALNSQAARRDCRLRS